MNTRQRAVICGVASLLVVAAGNLGRAAQSSPESRLTPGEIAGRPQTGPGPGASGAVGVRTTVLQGDPTKPGLYTLRLSIGPNTHVDAHSHRDERSATVVSGTWYFGYGDRFDAAALKPLPAGSFYTEPAGRLHFAQTAAEPVVVHVTGYGPTDTMYPQQRPPAE